MKECGKITKKMVKEAIIWVILIKFRKDFGWMENYNLQKKKNNK